MILIKEELLIFGLTHRGSFILEIKLITKSLNCPEPNAKNYNLKLKEYSNLFQSLNNIKLISAEFSTREELTLEFLGSFIIYVPSCLPDEAPENSYWHDHWYTKQLIKPTE